ncbi:MAG: hypothetical protein NT154_12940, partial [Verrucomicrobia bacterium]|nr:hypothetical protein [Verrucomicrobiota bacterium]
MKLIRSRTLHEEYDHSASDHAFDCLASRISFLNQQLVRLAECRTPNACRSLWCEPLTETLYHFLAGQYAIIINSAVRQAGGAPLNPETLAAFASDVAALRKGDQNAERLRLERHRVGIELKRLRLAMKDSHEKWKTKLTLAMEAFKTYLDDHPEATAAFNAFAQQVREPSGLP